MEAFAALMAHERQTQALAQVAGRLGWDQETVMPRGAAAQRAEEMEAMEHVLHARRSDPRIGDWLAAIDAGALDPAGQAALRLIRRRYARTAKVPAALAGEIARVTSEAQGIWAEARRARDFAAFAPTLARVVALRREEAAALAGSGDLYDALLDDYEPGATGAELQALFDRLRPRLVGLRDRVLGAPDQPAPLTGRFDEAAQMRLTAEVARAFGYDLDHGRIDTAVHPFSSGSGLDVRITTRTDPADPFGALYATIHETGHAVYEQNIDRAHLLTPLGQGVSMGVHESQSRIFENQIGRGRAFAGWLHGRFAETFGPLSTPDAEAFWRAANRVTSGFIRTEADEVTYNLHVLLRFDLERALISGALDVADLEEAWNARFLADFGVAVPDAAQGVLQDVHWSLGLFGYFPTYTLGNVYAGCLWAALRRALPDVEAALARGEARAATGWLAQAVQRHGGLFEPRDLIERATGAAPTEAPLLDYLDEKFAELYRL